MPVLARKSNRMVLWIWINTSSCRKWDWVIRNPWTTGEPRWKVGISMARRHIWWLGCPCSWSLEILGGSSQGHPTRFLRRKAVRSRQKVRNLRVSSGTFVFTDTFDVNNQLVAWSTVSIPTKSQGNVPDLTDKGEDYWGGYKELPRLEIGTNSPIALSAESRTGETTNQMTPVPCVGRWSHPGGTFSTLSTATQIRH